MEQFQSFSCQLLCRYVANGYHSNIDAKMATLHNDKSVAVSLFTNMVNPMVKKLMSDFKRVL